MIGREIGQYRITGKLGVGGMGEVWLAEDTQLERLVALKSLPLHSARDETEKERFTREAKAAALINHPHVAQVHEIAEEEGQHFIVMEYIDGGSLQDRLEQAGKKYLPLDETLEWMRQTAEGLAEAHSHGVIHRDIKPGNLLLDSHGWVKITDFGLARLETESRITVSGTTVGTVGYVSPEQILGEEVDQRSDLFSLGTVLYEIFTGVNPFLGSDVNATYYAVLNKVPDPPSAHRSALPPSLDSVVLRLLEKNPDARYQNSIEVADDIAEIQVALGYIPRLDLPGQITRTGVLASHLRRTRREPVKWKPVLAGVITTTVIAVLTYGLVPGLFQQFENQLYDARVRFALSLEDPYDPDSGLFLIRIDNRALSNYGRFGQWPRTMHSSLAQKLAGWGASAVFFDLLFSQQDIESVIDSSLSAEFREAGNVYCPVGMVPRESFVFDSTIDEHKLLENAPNTAIPIDSIPGADLLPDMGAELAMEGPLEEIYQACAGLGLVNLFPDRDNVVRSQPLLIRCGNWVIPTAGFRLFMDVMGIGEKDLRLVPGRSLHAGEHVIPVDTMGRMLLRWYPAAPPYRDLSYYDVFEERVGEPEKIFAEGVCIAGATAPALGDMRPTPMLILMPGSEIHTIVFSNLSQGNFASAMGDGVGFLLTIILGGLVSWLAVRFHGLFGASLMVILLLLFIAVAFVSYLNWSYWVEMLRPAIGLLSGYIAAFISTH